MGDLTGRKKYPCHCVGGKNKQYQLEVVLLILEIGNVEVDGGGRQYKVCSECTLVS